MNHNTEDSILPIPDTLDSLMKAALDSFPTKIDIGRELANPFENRPRDSANKFIKPLPSLSDFDLPGIKLDLFKKFNPSIVSITDIEN